MDLTQKHCVPCEGGTPPISTEEAAKLLGALNTKWEMVDGKKIRQEFKLKDFKQAMIFVNKIAEVAESEGHHPDISIFYNRVVIELWTHAANGLTENDFIVAAKVEKVINE